MTINATDLFERYLYDEGLNDYIDSSIPNLEGNIYNSMRPNSYIWY